MNEVMGLLPAMVVGVILGVLFFGGLWLTIHLGLRSDKTALIFTGSFILRVAITLLGFYFVGADSWQKLLVCLGGFLLARLVVSHVHLKNNKTKNTMIKEVSDET